MKNRTDHVLMIGYFIFIAFIIDLIASILLKNYNLININLQKYFSVTCKNISPKFFSTCTVANFNCNCQSK